MEKETREEKIFSCSCGDSRPDVAPDRWEDRPVSVLYGVGKSRAAAYARLGIFTVSDLLHHYPRAYEDRSSIRHPRDCPPGEKCALLLVVATAPRSARIRAGMTLTKFRAYDPDGGPEDSCEITFFNQPYLEGTFLPGATFRFYGKVERTGRRFTLSSPAFEAVLPGKEAELPPLCPVYPAGEGLSQKQIASSMALAIRLSGSSWEDPLPETIRTARGLCTYGYALRQIHQPESLAALSAAKRRLIYDEFFLFALRLAVVHRAEKKRHAPPCTAGDPAPLLALLPYTPTDDQRRVMEEIRTDMRQDTPMSRMIIGDVGCGKTVCAAAAILYAVQSGRQAALMAPTEILARQHASDLIPLFARLGIRCELLVGATPAAQKRAIRQALTAADPRERLSVVIGTQALLSDGVAFAAPGLVVTDEQHRFGVIQRALLSEKGKDAHLLVMSATPIPRSLALGLYGDLELSRIEQMPPGRQTVDTYVVGESYRARLNAFILRQTEAGGQVYVVCPAIEDAGEEIADAEEGMLPLREVSTRAVPEENHRAVRCPATPPTRSVLRYTEELHQALPDLAIACLHGKRKPAEKDAVMQDFVSGRTQVLVSTTVIEVGVNVPNASLMIVENAERFGLSQLHQLRGRVGRGSRKSYCILVAGDGAGETARRRLEVMRTQHDGFEIARQDLLLRGPGDFLGAADRGDGIRQSGALHFRLADQCDDAEEMTRAFADARELLEQDGSLAGFPLLRRQVDRMFSLRGGLLS